MRRRLPSIALSSLGAGMIAAIIYAIIFVSSTKNVTAAETIIGALLLGAFTFVVAFIINIIISTIVARSRA